MTDLTQAIEELRQARKDWPTGDIHNVLLSRTKEAICRAVLADALIPRADADLAVALMVEKAADIVGMCDQVGADAEGPVRALVPTSALAELQALRDERDDAVASQFITRVERDGAEDHATETADELRQVRARAEAAEAKLVEWQASQHYAYIGRDGKTVLARDLEGRAEAAEAELSTLRAQVEKMTGDTFYIDCEFDGHNGPLLSIAMVRGDGRGLHVKIGDHNAVNDPWVRENVIPIMDSHHADLSWHVQPNEAGTQLRGFIGDCQNPKIIADSPVDIARFCRAISTAEDGGWHSSGYASMTLIVRNVDCYPTKLEGAVQHNAWWDAMALRALLAELEAKA